MFVARALSSELRATGMSKNASNDVAGVMTWEDIPNWVPYSSYPDAQISGNELVVVGSGIAGAIQLAISCASGTIQIRIVRNGSEVLVTSSVVFNPTISVTNFALNDGDRLKAQVYKSTPLTRTLTGGSLLVVPAQ